MKRNLLCCCISISLACNLLAQKHGELQVIVPVTTIGKYELSLPNDMRAGDMISGLLKSIPSGKKENEIAKNATSLSQNNILIGSHNFPGTTSAFNFMVTPEDIDNMKVKVNDPVGKLLSEIKIDLPPYPNPVISKTFLIPSHAVTGNPLTIPGPFDGNSSNTTCKVNGQDVVIVAESPRQVVIQFPADVKGQTTILISDNGISTTEKIGGVDYTVGAGRLNLKRGESTHIDVSITGLENLKENATLRLNNLTTGVVVLAGGNQQAITILPADISGQGSFSKRFTVQSLMTGSFTINVDLDLPPPPGNAMAPSLSNWVACDACGGVMMPATTCALMTQQINQHPGQHLTYQPDTSCACFTFNPVITNDGNISLNIEPSMGDKIATVVYTTGNNVIQNPVPKSTFTAGANIVTATAYHGSNYTSSVKKSFVVIPTFNTSITNNFINELRRRIQQVKDSIDNFQRIIDNGNRRNYDNYPTKRRLDSIHMVRQGHYNQLVTLDKMLESIPKVYADTLSKLLDSLSKFRKKVPEEPDVDALKKRVADLEDALKACEANLQSLTQEQKDLQKEMSDVEQQQSGELKKILDCFAASGYDYVGHTTRTKDGEFGYGFDAVKNGQALNGTPAQCLKTVSDSKNKIEELKKRHREMRDRLKKIPEEITQAKSDCEKLSKELQDAQNALKKGKNALVEYGYINSDLDDICRQIGGMLDQLVRFCKTNPSVCNAEAMVHSLMANCPQANFWEGFNNLISYKKGAEDNAKKQADDAKRQLDQNWDQERQTYEEINRAQQQQAAKAAVLDQLIQQEELATQTELEKQLAKEDSARAMRRRDCEEFLKTQAKTKEEEGWIETILSIKKGVQSFGDNVKTASEYGDKLTKERYKAITDSLRSIIDRMLTPLKDYDKIKKNYDKWAKIKADIETVFSADDSPKANAEKMKVILKRIKEQLDNLVEEFPILELFVNYFGFLVDGYEWAVDQSFQNAEKFYKYHLETRLRQYTNCNWLMNEYLKRKNIDDVVRRAKDRIKWSDEIEPLLGAAGNRDVAEAEMKKLVTKMLADCCLSYLVE